MIKLKGMNTQDPVLVFFEVERKGMPNVNSFQDAHEAWSYGF